MSVFGEKLGHLPQVSITREGGRHTVYVNPTARKVSTIPRHREINDFMAKKICRELEIVSPGDPKKPERGESDDATDTP